MNAKIFREYDIRGIADVDLTPEIARKLGLAMGTYLERFGKKRIALGRDNRPSSDTYHSALIEGLTKTGRDIIDIGVCPTPLLYYSIFHLNSDGGIMITGSHNPPEYNGFKVCVGPAAIYGDQIQELRRIAEEGCFFEPWAQGKVETYPIIGAYLNEISGKIKLKRPVHIAVDCGNGTASLVAPELFRRLGCNIVELYCWSDGTYPNHHPDPTVAENLEDLIAKVREVQAEVGIAFDGDADRIGVVDDAGKIIWGDQLLVIFARDMLRRRPGAMIISEVKASKVLFDDIARHGGRPLMWRTGHSLIKAKMKEEGAVLAGEMSGHIFFADDYYGYDDAIYAACRLLEIISQSEQPLSALLRDLPPTVITPEIRVECPDEIKFQVVDRLRDFFKEQRQVVDVDGARILFEDGWGLVRASNTQPALVLRFEAPNEQRVSEIREAVESVLRKIMAELQG